MNPDGPVDPELEALVEDALHAPRAPERSSTPSERGEMSVSEFRFLEPFLDKACFMCGKKDSFRRARKLVVCTGCHTEFMPMPDGKLAVMNRLQTAVA